MNIEHEIQMLWSALDKINVRLDEAAPVAQHAPSPDYRMAEFDGLTEPGVPELCSCDESLGLRERLESAAELLDLAARWFESPQHTVAHGAKITCMKIRAFLSEHR